MQSVAVYQRRIFLWSLRAVEELEIWYREALEDAQYDDEFDAIYDQWAADEAEINGLYDDLQAGILALDDDYEIVPATLDNCPLL